MNECRTVSISIAKPPGAVYDYLADPLNFPRWSQFITAIRPQDDHWLASTPNGDVRIVFAPRNAFGILDHAVTVNAELTVQVLMRVVPNKAGSEVLFTVFRSAGMSPDEFETDIAMVLRDLASLKHVLEQE